MLAQVLQIFLGKEHLVKNLPIFTLDKVIYFKRKLFFCGLQNLSSLHKQLKNCPFFNMRVLDLDFYALAPIIFK
jgi:hypothetical protein